ncbi:MAG: hypothetical protein JO161_04630, partial [Planctomycetaceae bacterium]|nr:hypothetical protein [Planctomycetaceae bacterium]
LMNLTEYLFARLRELGVGHTFGIPGDFVLPVYAIQEALGFPPVVCCHEPGVGFAADAYSRLRGLGVGLLTYGPGALNALNAVACAYAEQSPLLIVSGGPELSFRRGRSRGSLASCREDLREPATNLPRGDRGRGHPGRSGIGSRDHRPCSQKCRAAEAARIP